MAAKRGKQRKEAVAVEEPQAQASRPETVDVIVAKIFPNPMWVLGVDKDGKQYKVRIPRRYINRVLHKPLTVKAIDGELEEYYKYEP